MMYFLTLITFPPLFPVARLIRVVAKYRLKVRVENSKFPIAQFVTQSRFLANNFWREKIDFWRKKSIFGEQNRFYQISIFHEFFSTKLKLANKSNVGRELTFFAKMVNF